MPAVHEDRPACELLVPRPAPLDDRAGGRAGRLAAGWPARDQPPRPACSAGSAPSSAGHRAAGHPTACPSGAGARSSPSGVSCMTSPQHRGHPRRACRTRATREHSRRVPHRRHVSALPRKLVRGCAVSSRCAMGVSTRPAECHKPHPHASSPDGPECAVRRQPTNSRSRIFVTLGTSEAASAAACPRPRCRPVFRLSYPPATPRCEGDGGEASRSRRGLFGRHDDARCQKTGGRPSSRNA